MVCFTDIDWPRLFGPIALGVMSLPQAWRGQEARCVLYRRGRFGDVLSAPACPAGPLYSVPRSPARWASALPASLAKCSWLDISFLLSAFKFATALLATPRHRRISGVRWLVSAVCKLVVLLLALGECLSASFVSV